MKPLIIAVLGTLALVPAATAEPLPKEVQQMDCLVGTWSATGTFTLGKDVAKVKATWTCKRTSAEYGVLCNLALTGIPGVPLYSETDLFGFDPAANMYHWFSVTSGGETHDHAAPYTDGDAIQFVYNAKQEGKPFKETIDLKFGKQAKTFTLRSETFVGGVSTGVLALSAKK